MDKNCIERIDAAKSVGELYEIREELKHYLECVEKRIEFLNGFDKALSNFSEWSFSNSSCPVMAT